MKIKLGDLLGLIAKESDQEEFLDLSRQFNEAQQARKAKKPAEALAAESQSKETLDQIMERLRWHFRAIRHPMPTRQELEEIIKEHFE
jgi:hypothetical protein